MENNLHSLASPSTCSRVNQIALDELHPLQANQVLFTARDKVIDSAHCFAARQQRRRNRPPDKPRYSRYKVLCQISRFPILKCQPNKSDPNLEGY